MKKSWKFTQNLTYVEKSSKMLIKIYESLIVAIVMSTL